MVIYTKALKSMMPRRLTLAVLMAAGSISSLFADNKITVEDFTIVNGKQAVVSVRLQNDPDVIGLGAKITLPAGMTIVPQYDEFEEEDMNFILNASRTYDPDKIYDEQTRQRHYVTDKLAGNTYTLGIANNDQVPFIGNSGDEIFHF